MAKEAIIHMKSFPAGFLWIKAKGATPTEIQTNPNAGRTKHWSGLVSSLFIMEDRTPRDVLWSLFWISFATLYIEVMLIRWIGTEVRVFAYFQNLALIACFLGFGLGCYWSGREKNLLLSLIAMAVLFLLVEAPVPAWKEFLATISALLSLGQDANLWGFLSELPREGVLYHLAVAVGAVTAFLLLLVFIMVPLGQWVGYFLDQVPEPIVGYSVNLLGGVAGIWVFAGMAFLWLPPEYWFGLAFLLCLLIRPPSWKLAAGGLLLAAGSLALFLHARTGPQTTFWSPYQKLELLSLPESEYFIQVNNTGYMTIANVTPDFLARHPERARVYRTQSSYDTPFAFAERHDRVLIVGAGAGNDAAAALRNGCGQVDAVEIDPVILFLGERLHPEEPYSSSRVRKILNDARAFLRQTKEKYDVIVFGLLDSHTQFSDFSNMRIDNYVYTEDAFREARRLLKPHGILVLKFEVRAPWTWMGQRFYAMLTRIFGRPPIVFYVPQVGVMLPATEFIISDDPALWSRASQPPLAELITQNRPAFPLNLSDAPPAATDDWPYVYHRSRSIPHTFLSISLILFGLSMLLVRRVLEARRISTWHFFCLGVGFLLLETQLVSRLALYFGTTWLVNCIALTAILLTLVVANLYVARRPPNNLRPYYILLIVSLFANYFFPWPRLPFEARTVGLLMSAAYSLSVFFAGIVFTEMFRRCERKSSAFGANIVGAVAGGLAQNLSFIVGMKALLLVAALFYAAASLCGYFEGRQTVPQEELAKALD